MTTITTEILKHSYFEATQKDGLIDLTKQLRDKSAKLKINDLHAHFSKASLWTSTKQATGHCKFTHKVTGVIVEYQGHNSSKDTTIYHKIQDQILNQVQKHLNILCNDIFQYKLNNWKKEPDLVESLERYKKLYA